MAKYVKPQAGEPAALPVVEKLWTSEDVTAAVNRAVMAALKGHKERGESIVIWRDGKIVTLSADEIEI